MTVPSDHEDRPSLPVEPRRRDTLILAIVGLAVAVLLFASAAVPVLSDRTSDDASGTTAAPATTVEAPATTTSSQNPTPTSSSPPTETTDDDATPAAPTAPPTTTPPTSAATLPPSSTTTAPSTSTATLPSTTSSTAPRAEGPESTAVQTTIDRAGTLVGRLAIGSIDASTFPQVAFDIVVPDRLAAVQVRPQMVDVDGASVDTVTAVDPRDVGVALLLDDGPTVDAAVVGRLQGASVELVRNLGPGSEVAITTPSGLSSAFTSSRDANISRIAAITAGSPAVAPMPRLLTSSIRELAANPTPDRHAVLVVGSSVQATADQLAAVERALITSGTQLHVISPNGVDAGAIASVAEASGGVVASSPNVVASIDEVTAAIARRYRVVATIADRGEHSIALTANGVRYEAAIRSS